jgi:hypothetical protein
MVHLLRESSTRSLGRHGLNSHVKKEVASTVDVHEKSGRMDSQILSYSISADFASFYFV